MDKFFDEEEMSLKVNINDDENNFKTKNKKQFIFTLLIGMIFFGLMYFLFLSVRSESTRLPSGFVYLKEIIPEIQFNLRYASDENFIGHPIIGYRENVLIITKEAAFGLQKAQSLAREKGYDLVIYDGYRPQKSVNQFVNWSLDENDPQIKKSFYYPRVNKEDTFQLGYIARKSGHSRGSTIDLTLIRKGEQVQSIIVPILRLLRDRSTIYYLNDGTIDMGSSFDLFDEASHTNSSLVNQVYQQNRMILKDLMQKSGFKNYDKEWWHFTLKKEPFPKTYFDFDIQ